MIDLTKTIFYILATDILEKRISAEKNTYVVEHGYTDKIQHNGGHIVSFLVNSNPMTLEYKYEHNNSYIISQMVDGYKKVFELFCFQDYFRIVNSNNEIIAQMFLKEHTNTGVFIKYGRYSTEVVSEVHIEHIYDNKFQITIKDIYIYEHKPLKYKLTERLDLFSKLNLIITVCLKELEQNNQLLIKNINIENMHCSTKQLCLQKLKWILIEQQKHFFFTKKTSVKKFEYLLVI